MKRWLRRIWEAIVRWHGREDRSNPVVFRSIFNKVKQGLTRTRQAFTRVTSLFRLKGRVDRKFLEELEAQLYHADVGTEATTTIVDRVRQAFQDKEITGDV